LQEKIVDVVELLKSLGDLPKPLTELEKSREKMRFEFDKSSDVEKVNKIYELRMNGFSVQSIARMYGVHQSTIYRWLERFIDEYKQTMEQRPAASIVAESLLFINRIKDLALYEIHQATREKEGDVSPDFKTGEVKHGKKEGKLVTTKYFDIALKAERLALNLMLDTGIIPREPDKIYHTLKGGKPTDDESIEDERSEEEIRRDVWKLLQHGRRL
jgi:transposase